MSKETMHEIKFGPIRRTGRHGLMILNDDGQPLTVPLLFDVAPRELDSHLVAAAGVVWGAHLGRRFRFEGDLNEQIVHTWDDAGVAHVAPAGFIQEMPEGQRFTTLSVQSAPSLVGKAPGRDETVLGLVPGERFYGALTGVKERIVGSNAWMFDDELGQRAQIAAGVLFADDLLVASIGVGSTLPTETAEFIRQVLAPLGLSLNQKEQ